MNFINVGVVDTREMIRTQSYVTLCVCLSCFKLLFLKSYVSTDFDVHRNWMAITYNLPIKEWYYDTTYEGTLDYPPLFATFEFLLALIAHFLNLNTDGELLKLTKSQVRSDIAIIYQKTTVILSDCVYYLAVYKLCKLLEPLVNKSLANRSTIKERISEKEKSKTISGNNKDGKNSSDEEGNKLKGEKQKFKQQVTDHGNNKNLKPTGQILSDAIYRPDSSTCIALLLLFQPGLLLVDHIHFQYNGFLSGVLLLSIASIVEGKYLSGSFWFSILLNLKHIYLYCAPAYGMYLLSSYCLAKYSEENRRDRVKTFIKRAGRLGSVVILVFIITYFPFFELETLRQIATRLFPFKRGLTHAYWAPNAWSLYNLTDKILATIFKDSLIVKFDLESISRTRKVSSTSGLVEEYEHQYLTTIKPITTFLLVGALTIPIVVKYLLSIGKDAPKLFIKGIVLTSFTSFMFGWHVHEKAIITVILPLVPLCYLEPKLWPTFLRLTLAGTYSLFPLLFKPADYLTKISLIVAYYTYARSHSPLASVGRHQQHTSNQHMNFLESIWHRLYPLLDKAYLIILILNELYTTFLFGRVNYNWNPVAKLNKYEFLPLMSTSSLSAIGIAASYVEIYYDFVLSASESVVA